MGHEAPSFVSGCATKTHDQGKGSATISKIRDQERLHQLAGGGFWLPPMRADATLGLKPTRSARVDACVGHHKMAHSPQDVIDRTATFVWAGQRMCA
jgi:hypothetical protein